MMELTINIATIFHRYHFVLEDPNQDVCQIIIIYKRHLLTGAWLTQLPTHEGFLRKPERVHVGLKRRSAM